MCGAFISPGAIFPLDQWFSNEKSEQLHTGYVLKCREKKIQRPYLSGDESKSELFE